MISIPLNIKGLEKRRRSIRLLHILAGFFLMSNASATYKTLEMSNYWLLAPIYLVAFASLIYGFFRNKLDPNSKYNRVLRIVQAVTFLALGLAYLSAGFTAKSIGLLLWVFIAGMLSFSEQNALASQDLILEKEGVSFPNGLYRKKQTWKELSDVTIRTDFLTIHYPDNRFLQFETKTPLNQEETQKLQDFCRRHLDKQVAGI